MLATLLAPLTAILYLAATGVQLLHMSQRRQQFDRKLFVLALLALLCHATIIGYSASGEGGLNFGFYKVSALIFLVVNVACVATLARRPLQNLLVVLFPLSALSTLR